MKLTKIANGLGVEFDVKMRLSVLVFFFLLLRINANTYSQNTKLSIQVEDTTIENVLLNEIQKRSDFKFFYENSLEDLKKTVSLNIRNKKIVRILDLLFANTNISYEVIQKQIVLTKIEKKPPVADPTKNSGEPIEEEPQLTISGIVTDVNGQPLPGANIVEKGTSNGVTTDFDGQYAITLTDENAVLVFSYIGFATQEVTVGTRTTLNVQLVESQASLDEVLVVGYGTQRKSDLTGSVASVKSEDLTQFPATDAVQALQGRAAGVSVQSTNGQPGADFRIRVRGGTSINASSDPLVVVDGFVGGVLPPPEDIASIEILKDASATAIYGSRGANGVILVTTKNGATGKPKINFSGSYTAQENINTLDLLQGQDFFDYVNDPNSASVGFFDSANFDDRIDWQDEIFATGDIQNYQLSVSGASETTKYYLSGTYFGQNGIIEPSDFNRISLTFNLDTDLSNRFNLAFSGLLQRSTQTGVETQQLASTGAGGNRIGVTTAAYKTEPVISIFDADGNFNISNFDPNWENPVAVANGFSRDIQTDVVQVNLKGTYKIVDGLSYTGTAGASSRNIRNGTFSSSRLTLSSPDGAAQLSTIRNTDLLTEHFLSFDKDFGKNNFKAIGGYSYQSFRREAFTAGASNFINDSFNVWNLTAGLSPGTPSSSLIESEISSFYGRVNYKYDNRYLLTFTGRYDGSSQFAEGNKWSFFPSAALGWNVSNEAFFPEDIWMSNLKLRASYGLTGNRAIQPFQSFARLTNTFFNPNFDALVPSSVANDQLTWETTRQFNIGANVQMFDGRISLDVDYFRQNTEDLLFSRTDLPLFSGFQTRLDNIGEIENRGLEIAMTTRNLTGDFTWTTDFNISFNRTEVISLPDNEDQFINGSPSLQAGGLFTTNVLRVGEPVGAFFGWQYEGVYQEGDTFIPGNGFEEIAGGERFADIGGPDGMPDGVLDENDRVLLGDPNPDFTFGFNNTFSYKGIDLNVFFQGSQGNEILNFTQMDLDLGNGAGNATTALLNRWSPTNTNTNVPAVNSARLFRTSSRFLEDGSYIRLKNLALGYNFQNHVLEKIGLESLRVYISGQNLLTITDYTGVDPEVLFSPFGSGLNLGLDYGSFPNVRSYTMGFNIGF
ncbi:MAG: TonB-dependent receptor [Bacteroidota bacterium]